MRITLPAAALLATLAGCTTSTPTQNAAVLLASYDAAVTAEVTYLTTVKVTPAEATTMRALRVGASTAVQAYVGAVQAGASNSAALLATAEAAVAALLAEAQAASA